MNELKNRLEAVCRVNDLTSDDMKDLYLEVIKGYNDSNYNSSNNSEMLCLLRDVSLIECGDIPFDKAGEYCPVDDCAICNVNRFLKKRTNRY